MHKLSSYFILTVCISSVATNRVYVHPFGLFALDNVTCETVEAQAEKPLKTAELIHIKPKGSAEPDVQTGKGTETTKQSITQQILVLAGLQNSLGMRLYQALKKQKSANALLSPVNTFGTLVNLYLGASKHTAKDLQQFLGLVRETDSENCVSLFDGHKVLRTLRDIGSLARGAEDELRTATWTFVSGRADLSEDFARGARDLSDASYVRAVDFTKPREAEARINSFVRTTSSEKIKNLFSGIAPSSDLLFASSIHFKGSWGDALGPEVTPPQEFWIDEKNSVKVPLTTRTGNYSYLNDKGRKCAIVKLPLAEETHMLLVLPHLGTHLDQVEAKLSTSLIATWSQYLKEGLLRLSVPRFSISTVNDLKATLSHMKLPDLIGTGASFQRLSTKGNFTVDQVLNKVTFEMTGDGSEDPDSTQNAPPALTLTVNRPFLFAVVEGNSDAILLLGRVMNPTQ